MNETSYTVTVYTASLYIDGVYKEHRSQERQAAADWLTDIMQRAGAVDLPITRPKITAQTVIIRKGPDWSHYALKEDRQSMYPGASSDPVILDWHPEWRSV